ncbi:MAG: gamma-glutamyltransferase family protein, partial [Bryobacteraceae bacterium]
ARGGSAVDAAIAANAVLAVTEPMMCGLGGDLFVLYREASTGKLVGLNSSGWAPQTLSIPNLRERGHKTMPRIGILSATVPGTVEGWNKLHQRYGRLPWRDLFDAATAHARDGFPVTEIIASYWPNKILEPPFLPARRAGDVFKNPALAGAFEILADGGPDAFYRGAIAEAILRTSQRLGGALSAGDLRDFEAQWVDPVSTTYRGWRVFELPPNGQGMAALEMLNILETFPAPQSPDADDLHRKIEAMKLAYADLRRYNADPRFGDVPVSGLISKAYAARRAVLIDAAQANCTVSAGTPPASSNDTTYLSVVDRDGNIASWIQSVSGVWGSGVLVDGMGFHLHNRGGGFSFDPAHPNALEPRKRPFHTIIPAYMEKDGQHIGFGIMGGSNQPLAHAQFVSHIADFRLNLQAALEAPRFTKRNTTGCDVQMERRIPPAVRQALIKRGHKVDVRDAYSANMGRGEAVLHNSATRVNFGASSPQGDGAAIPEPVRR